MTMEDPEVKERKVITKIIELYKANRILWDPSSPLYFNKDARNGAFSLLLSLYRKLKPAAGLKDIKKKMENMRTTFNTELKRVKESLATGKERHIPKLWYYDLMMFLEDNNVNRPRGGSQEEVQDKSIIYLAESQLAKEVAQESIFTETVNHGEQAIVEWDDSMNHIDSVSAVGSPPTSAPSSDTPATKKRRISKQPRVETSIMERRASSNTVSDEFDVFGQHIANQLRTLPPRSSTILQSKFQSLVTEEKLKYLPQDEEVDPIFIHT